MFSWSTRGVSFRYSEFYDVPRSIWLTYERTAFYLSSPFNEEHDEYSNIYSIYRVPPPLDFASNPHYTEEMTLLGTVRVKDVQFDATKRRKIDPTFLTPFLQS